MRTPATRSNISLSKYAYETIIINIMGNLCTQSCLSNSFIFNSLPQTNNIKKTNKLVNSYSFIRNVCYLVTSSFFHLFIHFKKLIYSIFFIHNILYVHHIFVTKLAKQLRNLDDYFSKLKTRQVHWEIFMNHQLEKLKNFPLILCSRGILIHQKAHLQFKNVLESFRSFNNFSES